MRRRPPCPRHHLTRPRAMTRSTTASHESSEFDQLRSRYRGFVIPATVAFLAWYLLYVVMSNWAGGFMNTQVVGHINVALVFGLLQFVTTFGLAYIYSRYSNAKLDPLARELEQTLPRPGRHRREARPGMSDQSLTTVLFLVGRRPDHRASPSGRAARPRRRGRLLLRRPLLLRLPERPRDRRRLHVRRLVPRHLRSHRRSTATTASSTPSASSSPGSSRCCSSPRCSATPGATRWPTSSPSG